LENAVLTIGTGDKRIETIFALERMTAPIGTVKIARAFVDALFSNGTGEENTDSLIGMVLFKLGTGVENITISLEAKFLTAGTGTVDIRKVTNLTDPLINAGTGVLTMDNALAVSFNNAGAGVEDM